MGIFDIVFQGLRDLGYFATATALQALEGAVTGLAASKHNNSPDYSSGQVTIPAANSTNTYAHGLGAVPATVRVKLINVIAEYGYAVGEVVYMASHSANNQNSFGVSSDATNVTIVTASTLYLVNKSTHGTFTPTSANWKIIVEAWKA